MIINRFYCAVNPDLPGRHQVGAKWGTTSTISGQAVYVI